MAKEKQCDNYNKIDGDLDITINAYNKSSDKNDVDKNRLCFGVCGQGKIIEDTVCRDCPDDSKDDMCSKDSKVWFKAQQEKNIPDLRYYTGPDWSDKSKVFQLWNEKDIKLSDSEIIQLGGEFSPLMDNFKRDRPAIFNTMDEWKRAINNNRGSKVDCIADENKPSWAECLNDKFGPNDVIAEEVYDWYNDTYHSKKRNQQKQDIDWSMFKGLKRNYEYERCMNTLLDTNTKGEFEIMERIKQYQSILDWKEDDIRYIEKKLKKIISLNPEKSSDCINILHVKDNICRSGISEKLFSIVHLINSILGMSMDLSSIQENTEEHRKLIYMINRMGHLVPKVFEKIIEISKYYELQKCKKVSANTLLLEKIYNELLVKPKNQTINWGIDIDFTYFRKLSVVEFIKTVVLMLVFAYFIKSLLDVIVAITTRK